MMNSLIFKDLPLVRQFRMKYYRKILRYIYLLFKPNFKVLKDFENYSLILDLSKQTQFRMNYFPYERENYLLFKKVIKSSDLIVEIGSHIGFFTIFFASIVKNGKVLAFEPESNNFRALKQNVDLNSFNNVEMHNCAIGQEISKKYFVLNNDNDGGHKVFNDKNSLDYMVDYTILKKKIDVYPLSKFSKNIDRKIKILKIDTEGNEEGVIKGCKPILSSKILKPKYIIIETVNIEGLEVMYNYLNKFNYKILEPKTMNKYNLSKYLKINKKINYETVFCS